MYRTEKVYNILHSIIAVCWKDTGNGSEAHYYNKIYSGISTQY